MTDIEIARACAERMMREDRASQSLGIQVEIPAAGEAVATMNIEDEHLNGFGICHGGFLFALADTAFAFACNAYNDLAVAAAGQIEYLKPVTQGATLVATATEDGHNGKRGFYTVRIRDEEGELVALFRGRSSSRGEALLK